VKDLPGVSFYCADLENYGYVVISAGERVVAFAVGMQGVSLHLPPGTVARLVSRGAQPCPEVGEGWVLLPLFGPGGFKAELESLAREAVTYGAPPSLTRLS